MLDPVSGEKIYAMTLEEAISGYFLLMGNSFAPAARPETVHVLRTRMKGDRGWAAFQFESVDGRRISGIAETRQQAGDRWQVDNAGWGIELGKKGFREVTANLAGEWGPNGCWGGGQVHGAAVHHVRLVDAGGAFDEDLVENGVTILFIEGPYRHPALVELYDADGALLATQPHEPPWWPVDDPPISPPSRSASDDLG